MLRQARLLFILFLVGALMGCGPIYETKYTYVPPKSQAGKMCVAQCVQNRGNCDQMCQMRNDTCRAQAKQNAVYQYELYRSDQERSGQPIKKSVSDFDDSYNCNNNCNCAPTYNACYSACGGQILTHKECVAFCDKA